MPNHLEIYWHLKLLLKSQQIIKLLAINQDVEKMPLMQRLLQAKKKTTFIPKHFHAYKKSRKFSHLADTLLL